jgi:hypothetical protein
LGNAGWEATFRLERLHAEISAALNFDPDLGKVKHEVADETALERTHPLYFQLPEHWEQRIQDIKRLKVGEFFFRKPDGTVAFLKSLPMHRPVLDPDKLAQVEDEYLERYFVPEEEIRKQIAQQDPTRDGGGSQVSRRVG